MIMVSDLPGTTSKSILITDANGSIVWCNQAFCALTGYTFDEVRGRNPRQLIRSGEQEVSFYQSMWKTILSGRVWRGRLVNRKKNGDLYVDEMTIAPVFLDETHISHFIAVKDDMTALWQTEQRLASLLDLLKSMPFNAMSSKADLYEFDARAGCTDGKKVIRSVRPLSAGSRAACLAALIANRMGMSEEQSYLMQQGVNLYELVRRSTPFHVVARALLADRRKQGGRGDETPGGGFPGESFSLPPVMEIAYTCHERWDGCGFPQGLCGAEIPLATRIFNLADMWDALTSDRYYAPPWQPQQAIEYLRRHVGSIYDPEVLDVFLDVFKLDDQSIVLNISPQGAPLGGAKAILVNV
jgi:PAS domain S-box-containing protein